MPDTNLQSEADLKDEVARLRLALLAGKVVTGDWDLTTQRATWSDGVRELLGLEPHESVNSLEAFQERVHPNDIPALLENMLDAIAGTRPYRVEFRVRTRASEYRWMLTQGEIIRDADGRPLRLVGTLLDITPQKEAEERQAVLQLELQKLLRRQRLILDGMPIGCVMNDADQRVAYFNPAAERMFGYSQAEVIGRSPFDTFVAPESRRYVAEIFRRLHAGDTTAHGVSEHVTRAGRRRVCQWHNTPVLDDSGRCVGFLSMATDITEQKRAEDRQQELQQRLESSLRRQQLILERMPLAFLITDREFRVTYCNVAAERIFRYPREELQGQNPLDTIVPPEARLYVESIVRRLLAGDTNAHGINENITKDGRRITCYWHNSPLIDESGKIYGLMSMGADITEQRRADDALRVKNQALETSLLPLVFGDLQAIVTDANPAFLRLWGYHSKEQIIGQHAPSLASDPAQGASIHATLVKSGKWTGEVSAVRPDGSTVELLMNASVVPDAEGVPICYLASFLDITERKQAAAERESLIQQLERKNAELERFTYTVSHDLKSPLVTISGFAGALGEDIAAGHSQAVLEDLQEIIAAAERMRRLLDELLELSRIGQAANISQNVDLGELVAQALLSVHGQLAESNAQLVVAPDLPVVRGDAVRLLEVLQNLLDNAIKFSAGVSQPRIEVGQRTQAGECVVFVRDNGVGIEAQYLQRVFELFEQLDPGVRGTGIGLAIVKRIIEVHGGRIWAESPGLGQGTTICFTLPNTEPVG